MDTNKVKNQHRQRRKRRVRKKVFGDNARPRLAVFRSLRNIYAQIIDDENGVTLVSAGTLAKNIGGSGKNSGNIEAAKKVGQDLAHKAIAVGIRQVRFDRAGYKYHGRIKALADAAREAGLVL